jgi:hypothetical protein
MKSLKANKAGDGRRGYERVLKGVKFDQSFLFTYGNATLKPLCTINIC